MARKALSDSIRWAVFARDGFCCRYCGRQAGEDGVTLAVDHIVSVKDGGDNRIDNLATACKTCNGGKAARSLLEIPTTKQIVERIEARASATAQVNDAMQAAIAASLAAERESEQMIVNAKCGAYGIDSCNMDNGEARIAMGICREFGPDKLVEWYMSAARHGVSQWNAIKYVCGCARTTREKSVA